MNGWFTLLSLYSWKILAPCPLSSVSVNVTIIYPITLDIYLHIFFIPLSYPHSSMRKFSRFILYIISWFDNFLLGNHGLNYCNILLIYISSFYFTVSIEQQELSFNKDINQTMSLLCSKWFSRSTSAKDIQIRKEYHTHLTKKTQANYNVKNFLEQVTQFLSFHMESLRFSHKIWNSWKNKKYILPIEKAVNRTRLRDDPCVGIHRKRIYTNYD